MWHLSRQASVGVLVIAGFILFAASAQAQHRHGHQHHGHHSYHRDHHHHHHSSHWHSNGIRGNFYQPSFGYRQPYVVYPQRSYYADPYCYDAIPLRSGYYPQTFGLGIQSGGFSLFLGR